MASRSSDSAKQIGNNHKFGGHGRDNRRRGTELLPPGHARVMKEDPPNEKNLCHYWRRGFGDSAFFRGGEMSSSGLKWKRSKEKPEGDGVDVATNELLSIAFASKLAELGGGGLGLDGGGDGLGSGGDGDHPVEFSATEWATFHIEEVRMNDFVQSSFAEE
eukprot:2540001-Prymnesium_polylepis.1